MFKLGTAVALVFVSINFIIYMKMCFTSEEVGYLILLISNAIINSRLWLNQ